MITKCYIIPSQKSCNCNCNFCISKERLYDKEIEFLKCDAKFIKQIELLKERGVKRFEITGGGEPLLNKDIQKILNLIKRTIPDSHIKLYTNGNIIKKLTNVDEINISIVHYDKETNDKFMNPSVSYDIMTKLKCFKNNHPRSTLRLSIPLIKGGIDSPAKLTHFIDLTKTLVDSYVVRTLYPKTKNLDNDYVDFDYNHLLVTMERDNDVNEFDGLILWSDGNIYTNWELNTIRNLNNKGYIMLKPDSQTYINEIEDLISENNFSILGKYLMNDFVNQAIRLYDDKLSNLDYYRRIKKHLELSSYLFGNVGLIMVLSNYDQYNKLLNNIYDFKNMVRSKYSFTGVKNGYINQDNDMLHLNLIHAPDPVISFCEKDMEILKQLGIFKNKIGEKEWQMMKIYSSYRRSL